MVILVKNNNELRDGKVSLSLTSIDALKYLQDKKALELKNLKEKETNYRKIRILKEDTLNTNYVNPSEENNKIIASFDIALANLENDIKKINSSLRNIEHALNRYSFLNEYILKKGDRRVKVESLESPEILSLLIQKYHFLNKTHFEEWKKQNQAIVNLEEILKL